MKVRELLSSPDRWTKGVPVVHRGDGNVAYCLLGAMKACYDEEEVVEVYNRVRLCITSKGWCDSVASWNDDAGRKFKHVRALVEELDI